MEIVRKAQLVLTVEGFHPGPIDGQMGPKTSEALRLYQRSKHLPVTGILDSATQAAMRILPPQTAPAAPAAPATPSTAPSIPPAMPPEASPDPSPSPEDSDTNEQPEASPSEDAPNPLSDANNDNDDAAPTDTPHPSSSDDAAVPETTERQSLLQRLEATGGLPEGYQTMSIPDLYREETRRAVLRRLEAAGGLPEGFQTMTLKELFDEEEKRAAAANAEP